MKERLCGKAADSPLFFQPGRPPLIQPIQGWLTAPGRRRDNQRGVPPLIHSLSSRHSSGHHTSSLLCWIVSLSQKFRPSLGPVVLLAKSSRSICFERREAQTPITPVASSSGLRPTRRGFHAECSRSSDSLAVAMAMQTGQNKSRAGIKQPQTRAPGKEPGSQM